MPVLGKFGIFSFFILGGTAPLWRTLLHIIWKKIFANLLFSFRKDLPLDPLCHWRLSHRVHPDSIWQLCSQCYGRRRTCWPWSMGYCRPGRLRQAQASLISTNSRFNPEMRSQHTSAKLIEIKIKFLQPKHIPHGTVRQMEFNETPHAPWGLRHL